MKQLRVEARGCATGAIARRASHAGWLSVLTLAALAACGGGGGGGGATETGQSVGGAGGGGGGGGGGSGSGSGTVAIDPLVLGATSFHFQVGAALTDAPALNAAVGGTLFTGWNPSNAQTLLRPGMKVLFFGKAAGCAAVADHGPVAPGAAADFAQAELRAGLGATTGALRWVPSADTPACDAATRAATGPSMVELDPLDGSGAVGLYTIAGPQSASSFFGAYDASGQDGQGTNAFIDGTYVAFRQDWSGSHPVQPWQAGATAGVARVVSTQSVGTASVTEAAAVSATMQVKQQISVTFLNTECAKGVIDGGHPCQVEYLFNTAILRTGVSDWSQVGWFQQGSVWFDPAQGGIPIVEGPVVAKGASVSEKDNNLSIFSSQGAPTQHAAFKDQNFDLRVSFDQLANVMRIVVARKLGVSPAQVGDGDLAATWGARWNDPDAWVLLNSEVGQEVYNPLTDRTAYLGGSFKQLYVGRHPS